MWRGKKLGIYYDEIKINENKFLIVKIQLLNYGLIWRTEI